MSGPYRDWETYPSRNGEYMRLHGRDDTATEKRAREALLARLQREQKARENAKA